MRYDINGYEKTHGLYMMFSVKDNRIHAFMEGRSGEEYLLRDDNLTNYINHLDSSINELNNMLKFFNNDYKIIKRLEKYQLYKKRLDNAISKIKKEVA